MRTLIMDTSAIMDAIRTIGHALGVVHVPELDNAVKPLPSVQPLPETAPKTTARVRVSQDGFKDALLGAATIDGKAKEVKFKSIAVENDYDAAGWDVLVKHRTKKVSEWIDCAEWHETDDAAIEALSKPSDVENYRLVRADVVDGLTNAEIGAKYNRTTRWAETHAGRVRAAFRIRTQPAPIASERG